jgi:hypothetical protein
MPASQGWIAGYRIGEDQSAGIHSLYFLDDVAALAAHGKVPLAGPFADG